MSERLRSLATLVGGRFEADLNEVRALASDATRLTVSRIVTHNAVAFADTFYDAMFRDPAAAVLLDHAVVNNRLHSAMRSWLTQLFDGNASATSLLDAQRRTGEVHARVGVPITMVSRGARVLKRDIIGQLATAELDTASILQAAQYVDEMMSLAVDEMATSFSQNANRLARSDEAYRLFFLGQDMKAERERRRSELLEWSQQILDRHYWQNRDDGMPVDEPSAFSLWLHHKATMLFDGAAEVDWIRADMKRVEHELLPQLIAARGDHARARAVVSEIHRCTDRIKVLLVTMFDRYLTVEDSRDDVTSLLNRRYFPSIVRREIEMANAQHTAFAVLMVDVDRFHDVAGAIGTESSNLLMAQVAALLQERVRAGDFLFRLGDDEFLALLVECDGASAERIADGLRQGVESRWFNVGSAESVAITVSVGVAAYDGHPDYQRLLDRADASLRRAKQEGRNRVCRGD